MCPLPPPVPLPRTGDGVGLRPEIVVGLQQHWRDYVTRVDMKQPAFPPKLIQIDD